MAGSQAFLAVDWGTTQVRAWVIDDGGVRAARDFPLGVSRLGPGEAVARFQGEIRPALGAETLPAILCGMIGSNLGWTPVPYLDCPADLATLGATLAPAPGDANAWIVPGLRGPGITAAPDVLRGEETQVVGWLAQDEARKRGEHVICLPGTHAKWVLVQDGRIVRFITAMTGELFDILIHHSVLRSEAPADNPAAFRLGVLAAGDGGALSARLFSARSRVAGGDASGAETASYLSGLLIGSELLSVPPLLVDQTADLTVLIGEHRLCERYLGAMRICGCDAAIAIDGGEAALIGLTALYRQRNTG